ncbi:hypothetical protein, partial [Mycoplasmopsis bovis]|uniref:hypothetical protein n=1 Tax=Mycoplasmopsis bovis TaxID=28903 RepID=UPI003D2DAD63
MYTFNGILNTKNTANVINKFIIFGSVKSKINLFEKDEALSKEQVRYVSNSIFYESFKNNLFFLIVSALVF